MRISSVQGSKFKDGLARKRRRRFLAQISLALAGIVFCLIGIGYGIFFSGWFDLNDYQISGAKNIDPEVIKENLNTYRDYRFLHLLPIGRNILFFDVNDVENNFLKNNNMLKTIQIEKRYFHALSVQIVEREPMGVWCFENYIGGHKCKYFDDNMQTWGALDKTFGFVLLTIEDRKTMDRQDISKEYFDGVKILVNGLHSVVGIKSIIIPDKSIGDMIVNIDRPYYLRFSLESNLADQIESLKIFLNNKKDDITFAPQYLDLRIDGRVYYK